MFDVREVKMNLGRRVGAWSRLTNVYFGLVSMMTGCPVRGSRITMELPSPGATPLTRFRSHLNQIVVKRLLQSVWCSKERDRTAYPCSPKFSTGREPAELGLTNVCKPKLL
jgi:hypothetical protein